MRSRGAARLGALLAALAAALALAACGGAGGDTPSVDDPAAEETALVDGFFTALREKDADALDELLAPEFQVVRANGSVAGKDAYLAALPEVAEFSLESVRATLGDGELVVSYTATVSESVGGAAQPEAPAPRLSVFAWRDGAWRLVAHANLGAVER